jgi:hypothetical protein
VYASLCLGEDAVSFDLPLIGRPIFVEINGSEAFTGSDTYRLGFNNDTIKDVSLLIRDTPMSANS